MLIVDGKRDTTPAKVVEMQWGYDGSEAAREQGFVCVKVLSDATDVWKGASEAERRSSWVDAKNYDKI